MVHFHVLLLFIVLLPNYLTTWWKMGDYPRLSPGLDPALWCTPIFHCMIALSFCNRCMDNFWGLCGCIFYHLNLAEYISWRIRRLRRGCQENISVLNLTAFVVSKNFPTMKSVRGWFHIQQRQHQRNWRLAWPDVGYWPTADTFFVSWDSFKTLQFPAVSGVEMKIYGRSLQALPFFPTTHAHVPFRVLLSCL